MTAEEKDQIKDMVLRDLPRVLEQDPGFVVFIEGIISEKFPRRDEFARMLDELQSFRRESQQHAAQVDGRLDSLERHAVGVDRQFAAVDQQLAGVNQRFGEVDQRFDKMDQRFDKMDQRFDKMDQRFDKMDQRFERVEGRLENVEGRLEKVEVRLENVDGRLEKVEKHLERVDSDLISIRDEIVGLRHWMELNVGGFQTRAGRRLEDVVAGAFCYGLGRKDITPDQVRLRQKIEDTQGVVFRPGKSREFDIIAVGAEAIVFEVKSTADADDIEDLADKTTLFRHLHPDKQVQGVLVMLGAEAEHRRLCEQKGLVLIPNRS